MLLAESKMNKYFSGKIINKFDRLLAKSGLQIMRLLSYFYQKSFLERLN